MPEELEECKELHSATQEESILMSGRDCVVAGPQRVPISSEAFFHMQQSEESKRKQGHHQGNKRNVIDEETAGTWEADEHPLVT